ncbi:hypothetical protein HFO91_30610 [Rhizobium leguminosarum]|uniref:hypothetical protein n=1 Tax=Rhizobium leguminosarum TaxID=384 RepID=UPI001C93F82B|nr:hypothetical protein [Rhizobium leguminosarum]MBY5453933.1 hypothetical protein [Rhizobium leguminosarum]
MRRRSFGTGLALLLSTTCALAAGTVTVTKDDLDTIILGSGYDLTSNHAPDRCIEPADDASLGTTAKGVKAKSSVEALTSRDETVRFFNMNFDSSGKGTVMKGLEIGGGLTAGYTRSTSFDENTVIIGVKDDVEMQNQTLQKFDLKASAKTLRASSPEAFIRSCGTMFISGYKAGGRLSILFQFSSLDKQEKEEIKGSMTFNMKLAFAEGQSKGDLTSRVDHYFHEGKLKIDVFYTGAPFDFAPPVYNYDGKAYLTTLDFNGMLSSASKFEKAIVENKLAYPYEIYVKPYDELIDYNSTSVIDKAAVRPIIEDLTTKIDTLSDLKGRIDEILSHPEEFEKFDWDQAFGWQAQVIEKINKVRTTLVACGTSAFGGTGCEYLPAKEALVMGLALPKRLKPYRLARGPECGDPVGWEQKTVVECPKDEVDTPAVREVTYSLPWKDLRIGGPNRGMGTIPQSSYKLVSDTCTKLNSYTAASIADATKFCMETDHPFPDGVEKKTLSYLGTEYKSLECVFTGKQVPCINAPMGSRSMCNVASLVVSCTSSWLSSPLNKCSENIYLDPSKPIYPICRDPSHGPEN